jgi:hypothetical protein
MDGLEAMAAVRPILEGAGVLFEPITSHDEVWRRTAGGMVVVGEREGGVTPRETSREGPKGFEVVGGRDDPDPVASRKPPEAALPEARFRAGVPLEWAS